MEIDDSLYHKIMVKDKYVQQLVKTKSMQRLKKIKQQGNTYILIKGAIHNRYEHSLGVYHIMQEMLEYLTFNSQLRLSKFEIHVALVSSILHDIGHGPFSHCFELKTLIDHEQWTEKFIKSDKEIQEILSKESGLSDAIISVIKREGTYKIIEELLFSELGADKLDYINRDLYYSREPIKGFNQTKIIQNTLITKDKLVYDHQALAEIENFFIIKKHLFNNTFFHPFVLGKDILL
ncbi:HD domain-containing protein, partial [Metasolibacillus meyeri]|uniref:HD domain-containing protein n=1 Tax=Metasolibacillus meyeri TaxID=1071052 RepID=UPI00128FEC50